MSLGISYVLRRSKGLQTYIVGAIATALLCVYACQANQYSVYWLTPKAYMQYAIDHYPKTPVAQTVVGLKELEEENMEVAMHHFQNALDLSPTFSVSRAHLGLALMKTGKVEEGLAEIQKIQEMKTDHEYTYTFLAFGHTLLGEYVIAEGLLNQVLSILPEDSKALYMLGILAEKEQRTPEAKAFYERSIASKPGDVRPKAALARLLRNE